MRAFDRATMCHWMKRCSELLFILCEALRLDLLSGDYLQIDETSVKLLDRDQRKSEAELLPGHYRARQRCALLVWPRSCS